MIEEFLNDYAAGLFIGFFTGLTLAVLINGFVAPDTPSVQLVENKKQETKTVCAEKDIDWIYSYTDQKWERLEQLPETGIAERDFYNLSEPAAWVTIDTEKANITPPEKVKYKAVSECVEYKQVPKYSKVEVEG